MRPTNPNQGAAAAGTQKVVCLRSCLVDSDGLHILGKFVFFVVVFFRCEGETWDTSERFDGLGCRVCCDRQSRGGRSFCD